MAPAYINDPEELTALNIDLQSAERFEPARYSIPDLHFLLLNMGTPPAVAMRKDLAPGVMKRRVKELLTDIYNLEQIRKAEDAFSWAGIEAMTDSITRFIAWHERSIEIRRRRIKDATGSIITYPSQYGWDEDGRAYRFAVDADAAEMVRSEILDNGERKVFGVSLLEAAGQVAPHVSEIAPWVQAPEDKAKVIDEVREVRSDKDKRVASWVCSICDFTQQFDPRDRGKRNMAMSRMHKHMKDAKTSINRHRRLLSRLAR